MLLAVTSPAASPGKTRIIGSGIEVYKFFGVPRDLNTPELKNIP